jgi:hypothetical protein
MRRFSLACCGLALLAGACTTPTNHVTVESLRRAERPELFVEQFSEGYYRTDEHGRWDIVLRSTRPMGTDARQTVEQVLHLRLFWKPVPGTTFVESSQTNAIITYALLSGPTAISYEGAGFVYLSNPGGRPPLTGRIESASLSPTRRTGEPADLFGPCRLTGELAARNNGARVTEILTDISQRLGPRLNTVVPEGQTDPR